MTKLEIAKAYEAALFAGRMDEVAALFTDDIVYWVAGVPPIGGTWRGRDAVLRAFENREPGLGVPTGAIRMSGATGRRRATASSSGSVSEAG